MLKSSVIHEQINGVRLNTTEPHEPRAPTKKVGAHSRFCERHTSATSGWESHENESGTRADHESRERHHEPTMSGTSERATTSRESHERATTRAA
jgi:hypothetical protein